MNYDSSVYICLEEGTGWAVAPPSPLLKCNSPPVNGQCVYFILFDVAPQLPLHYKGLSYDELCRNNNDDNETTYWSSADGEQVFRRFVHLQHGRRLF